MCDLDDVVLITVYRQQKLNYRSIYMLFVEHKNSKFSSSKQELNLKGLKVPFKLKKAAKLMS